ncbi:MAG: TonB-dependent receptor plug domain-containing protein [Bacteroidales bacterium]|nr:TonB-dependent receptor plug domain-containing protein [Bacteroidales bacterium]
MYKSLIIISLFVYPLVLFAQTDSTSILIGEVQVVSRVEQLNSANNVQKMDSLILQNYNSENLAVLLSKNAHVSIKQYGISGQSTLSVRGGNASHTAVIWNGFNLQDVLNGGFNFTLAPALIADEIDIKYGGSSAIYGSGAIGASIHLSNKSFFDQGFQSKTNFHTGSFGKLNLNQGFSFSNKKTTNTLKIFYTKTNNNFPFTNYAKAGFPAETLQNAAVEQYGLLFESAFKIKARQILRVHFWAQNNYSELPPNMIAGGNDYAKEFDRWYRAALNWKYKDDKISIMARNGFFYTYLNYINNAIAIDALHTSVNNISDLIADWRIFKKTSLEIALNNNFIRAKSDNFTGIKHQNRLALFSSLKTKYFKNFILNFNTRAELIDTKFQPVTFGFYAEYNLKKNNFINLNLSKNHRSPTFNDLFWGGAYAKGNPDLKDESAYTGDIGYIKKFKNEYWDFKLKTVFYYSITSNMIQWIPIGGTWTPQNQKRVQSYGLEISANSKIKFKEYNFIKINTNYTYTKAEVKEKSSIESEDILNKQLIYVPYHKANIFISYAYKKLSFSINNTYTGKQYTRTDNLDSLDAYFLMNLSAAYRFTIKKQAFKLYGKINNLLNTDYMQMQWYPMPPINYELGITIIIN